MRRYRELRFVAIIVCSIVAVSLLVIAAGVSTAQQLDPDHFVYLPNVAKPPCEDFTVNTYATTNNPIVHVGETFTVTMDVLNAGCAYAAILGIAADVYPPLTVPSSYRDGSGPPSPATPGQPGEFLYAFQATDAGLAEISLRGFLEYLGEFRGQSGITGTRFGFASCPNGEQLWIPDFAI